MHIAKLVVCFLPSACLGLCVGGFIRRATAAPHARAAIGLLAMPAVSYAGGWVTERMVEWVKPFDA